MKLTKDTVVPILENLKQEVASLGGHAQEVSEIHSIIQSAWGGKLTLSDAAGQVRKIYNHVFGISEVTVSGCLTSTMDSRRPK